MKAEEWLGHKAARDNSYQATFGSGGWGAGAQETLGKARPRSPWGREPMSVCICLSCLANCMIGNRRACNHACVSVMVIYLLREICQGRQCVPRQSLECEALSDYGSPSSGAGCIHGNARARSLGCVEKYGSPHCLQGWGMP